MHIFYTINNTYVPMYLVSMVSLLENNPNLEFHIHIGYDNLSKENIKKIEKIASLYPNATITFLNPEKITKLLERYNLPLWRNSKIANARVFFNELLPDASKVLYLDADTIITGDIAPLFEKGNNHPMGAVIDHMTHPKHFEGYIDPTLPYFNSGVLLFNKEIWEKEDCTKKLYNALKGNHPEFLFPDQDLLNYSLQNEIETLPIEYNFYPHIALYHRMSHKICFPDLYEYYTKKEIKNAKKHPKILHTVGVQGVRPWYPKSIHPFTNTFYHYLAKTNTNLSLKANEDCYLPSYFYQHAILLELTELGQTLLSSKEKELIKKLILKK